MSDEHARAIARRILEIDDRVGHGTGGDMLLRAVEKARLATQLAEVVIASDAEGHLPNSLAK